MIKKTFCGRDDCQQGHFKMQTYAYIREVIARRLTTYMSFINLLKETRSHSKSYHDYIEVLQECCSDIESLFGTVFKNLKMTKRFREPQYKNIFIEDFLKKLEQIPPSLSHSKAHIIVKNIEVPLNMKFDIDPAPLYESIFNYVRLASFGDIVQMGCSKITQRQITFYISNESPHINRQEKKEIIKSLNKNYSTDVPLNETEMLMAMSFHYIRLLKGDVRAKMTRDERTQFNITLPRIHKNES